MNLKIFQTLISDKSNILKYIPSGCKDIGTRQFELVAKTQVVKIEYIGRFNFKQIHSRFGTVK